MVRDRATQLITEYQSVTARLQRERNYYKKHAAARTAAVSFDGSRGEKQDRAGSRGSGSRRCSREDLGKKCNKKKYKRRVLCSALPIETRMCEDASFLDFPWTEVQGW